MELKTRLAEMTQNQIKVMNGFDSARAEELRNARAVLCTLKGQDANVNFIGRELDRMGA